MDPVSLLDAEAGTEPVDIIGTHKYVTHFNVLVDNLVFNKQVSVLAHDDSARWNFHSCSFSKQTPGNREVWQARVVGPVIDQFAIEYRIMGDVFWDNNRMANYTFDVNAAERTEGPGSVALNPNVAIRDQRMDSTGNLIVEVWIKNLAFAKEVGLVYTIDGWATSRDAFGTFQRGFAPFNNPRQPNAEIWLISAPVGINEQGQFAIFYSVSGNTFWDNNLGANYSF